MRTKEKILTDAHGCNIIDDVQKCYVYSGESVNRILIAMQEYAEEYHKDKLLKMNKYNVINSVCNHEYTQTESGFINCNKCGSPPY